MNLSNSQKKIVSNVAWSLGGKAVNMASALFVGILVARYLGPESYGLMNYVISYVAIFSIIATFGMDNIEIRELSRQNDKKDAIMGTCFCLRMFFATIAYIVIAISLFYFQTDKFTSLMVLAYGLTLFTGTGNLLRNYFTSIVQNKYIVKSEMYRTFVGAGIKILLLWIKAPLEYFIYAQIFDTALVASGYYLSYKSTVGSIRKWHFDKTLVPFILKESFPLVLSGAAVIIYQRIDQVMIGDMINKTEVGYFATAGKFVDLIVFLPMVLVQTVTPMLVREKENKPETYEVKKKTFVSITTWTAIIMSVMVSSLSYWLITYSHPCFANHGVQGCRNGVVICRRTNHHHGTHTKMGLHTKYIRLYPMCVAKLFPNSPIWNHRFLIRHNNHGIVHRMLRKPVDSHLPQRHEATTLCHIIRLERITLF